MNVYGRTVHPGKSLGKDIRSFIIDEIVNGSGDVSTAFYPGSFRALGLKCIISVQSEKYGRRFIEQLAVTSVVKQLTVKKVGRTRTRFGSAANKKQTFDNLQGDTRKYRGALHNNSFDFCYRTSCQRSLTRRENDVEKDDKASG